MDFVKNERIIKNSRTEQNEGRVKKKEVRRRIIQHIKWSIWAHD